MLRKVKGINFTKAITFNDLSENINFPQKMWGGPILQNKSLKRISMKTLDLGAKLPPEIRYFKHDFSKTDPPIRVLKILYKLPNLTSNFDTHNVRDNFLSYIQLP